MLLFDAHLDLSLNALDWNRDLRLPAKEIRGVETGMRDRAGRGAGTVTLPDMRRGHVVNVGASVQEFQGLGIVPLVFLANIFVVVVMVSTTTRR